MNRPTISEIQKIFNNEIKGKCFNLPLTKNKGLPGIILENKLGIPNSTACLDCADGELKLFPLKKLKNGTIVPKTSRLRVRYCRGRSRRLANGVLPKASGNVLRGAGKKPRRRVLLSKVSGTPELALHQQNLYRKRKQRV